MGWVGFGGEDRDFLGKAIDQGQRNLGGVVEYDRSSHIRIIKKKTHCKSLRT